ETTGTFKYKKNDLKRNAYDPSAVSDVLFVRLPGEAAYRPLDGALFEAIRTGVHRF
ncbi:hypothetical protein AADU03_005319, partial [Escherichia coli]